MQLQIAKKGATELQIRPNAGSVSAKGLLAGTRVKILDGSGEIVTAMYYDSKGRIIQKKSTNHLGGFDIFHFFIL